MLSAFIFIIGLAIGISAFLYFLSAISVGMKKIKKSPVTAKKVTVHNIAPDPTLLRGRKTIPPGARICPLCGSELTKFEGLYASKIIEKSENKIMIMGCKYCYKDK